MRILAGIAAGLVIAVLEYLLLRFWIKRIAGRSALPAIAAFIFPLVMLTIVALICKYALVYAGAAAGIGLSIISLIIFTSERKR